MGIRLVVIDDNPHVTSEGRVHPVNATFHRFLAGLLDLPEGPVASIVHCVPLRAASARPATLPLDPRLEVVGTAPFDGIGGYLRHAPSLLRRNRRILRPIVASGDLIWIKVPASNALLAGWLAWRAGVPRFGYVAGSARAVARGRGLGGAAQAVGLAYDLAGRLAGGRHRIVVGEGLIGGDGIVTSLVEPEEIRDPTGSWAAVSGRLRLAWAGRLSAGKGLEALLDAVAELVSAGTASADPAGRRIELAILGDGPARAALEARATQLGIGDRIDWLGYVADRPAYLAALAACDIFVFPSPAEGFPKVVLDAMAVGLPVIATRTGALGELVDAGLIGSIERTDQAAIVAALGSIGDSETLDTRRLRALHFAADHTHLAESTRLVARWRDWWPDLPWDR